VDSEDPLAFLNGRYSVNFFALESCTAVNSRKGDVNGGCGLSCTRGVASITWGLEEHSSCMLVKEQPATRAREDLVSTCGQIKLTQFGLCDSDNDNRKMPTRASSEGGHHDLMAW
jgi:hypothetical protein